MKKTVFEAIDDLESIYNKIIELQPYLNEPETNRQIRELRKKATVIGNAEIDY